MSDGISNTFQQRRQLAIAVSELAVAEDARNLVLAAREIYDAYPDDLIQAELLRQLETPDSQLRGGLGQLAALLPSEQISTALRGVAADRGQSAQRRLTAAMLASQYLHESVPAALLSDLSQGNEVAFQSLLEAVEDGKHNRHILLEYVLQMRQAGNHVPPMILDLLDRLPDGDRVELLRLIALDDRETVAISALSRLELLASSSAGAEALRALHVLQFMLAPPLVGYAQDALRRQRFRGNVYRPAEPAGWRALMSISDLMGNQALWFVRMPSETVENGVILYLTLNNHTGRIDALANEEMLADELPPQQPIGQIVPVETDAARQVSFLEVPFDFARWRLLELLPGNWEADGELSPEFRLYADHIWEFAVPEAPANLQRFFEPDDDDGIDENSPASSVETVITPADLRNNPAMAIWLHHNQSTMVSLPEGMAQVPKEQRTALARTILAQIEQQSDSDRLTAATASGMRAQAAWFEISRNPQTANLALELAKITPRLPVSQNPLLMALIEIKLREPQDSATDAGFNKKDDLP